MSGKEVKFELEKFKAGHTAQGCWKITWMEGTTFGSMQKSDMPIQDWGISMVQADITVGQWHEQGPAR